VAEVQKLAMRGLRLKVGIATGAVMNRWAGGCAEIVPSVPDKH
jgi:hypothetical protein